MKQQSITGGLATDAPGNQTLYGYLLSSISACGGGVATWVQNLPPLNGDYANNVIFEEWQSSPYFGGAFKLSQPGQDQYTQKMFYQKAGGANDTAVYLAGDCIARTSGSVEGAAEAHQGPPRNRR